MLAKQRGQARGPQRGSPAGVLDHLPYPKLIRVEVVISERMAFKVKSIEQVEQVWESQGEEGGLAPQVGQPVRKSG